MIAIQKKGNTTSGSTAHVPTVFCATHGPATLNLVNYRKTLTGRSHETSILGLKKLMYVCLQVLMQDSMNSYRSVQPPVTRFSISMMGMRNQACGSVIYLILRFGPRPEAGFMYLTGADSMACKPMGSE